MASSRGAAAGFPDQAAEHTQRAHFHLCYAKKLAREWSPDTHELICKVRFALSWQIGCLGYGIAADLVEVALDKPISRWPVRYVVKSLSN